MKSSSATATARAAPARKNDAVLNARLTAQLRCYVPEPVDKTWARQRHLGARRDQLLTEKR